MKFREIAIALFLASAFVGTGVSYGKIYLFHILFIALTAYSLWFKKLDFSATPKGYATKFPLVLALFFSLSIFWTPSYSEGFRYLAYLFMACGIIYLPLLIIRSEVELKKSIRLIGILSAVEILIGFLEHFTSFRYPISPYSRSISLFKRDFKIGNDISESALEYVLSSPTGFHWNPNNFSAVMVILLPFFFCAKNWWIKIGGVLSCTFLIFVSNSRTAIIALILVLFVSVLQSVNLKRKRLFSTIGVSVFILLFVFNFTSVGSKANDKIQTSFSTINSFISDYYIDKSSIGSRQKIMSNALIEVTENEFLGSGIGASEYSQLKYGKPNGKITSIHNYWLEILIDGGILICLAFILWYIVLIRDLGKTFNTSNSQLDSYSRACISALFGSAIMAFSVSSFVYFLPFWVLISISLLVLKLRSDAETREETPQKQTTLEMPKKA